MSQLSPSPLERILELKDEAEKQKLELTPEVKAYIQTHLEIVQGKMSKGEVVTEDDMKFIDEVRLMIEALKRKISVQQWKDLLHMADAAGKPSTWIDEVFRYPGNNIVEASQSLDLTRCTSLTHLPEKLTVMGNLSLGVCTSLKKLPDYLEVEGDVILSQCTSLTHLSGTMVIRGDLYLVGCTSLICLSENLKVGKALNLKNCTSLSRLPEHVKVGTFLSLFGCTNLKYLPEDLEVGASLELAGCGILTVLPENLKVPGNLILGGCVTLSDLPNSLWVGNDLYLSSDLQPKVKIKAENLKKARKIKGEILFE